MHFSLYIGLNTCISGLFVHNFFPPQFVGRRLNNEVFVLLMKVLKIKEQAQQLFYAFVAASLFVLCLNLRPDF